MNLLPFAELPVYQPRSFVPEKMDLGDWSRIAPLFDKLEAGAPQCRTSAAFERWLLEGSELTAALDEESSRRYIAMTCHTENGAAEAAFLHFIGQIEPRLKPRQFKLAQIFLAHPLRAQLPGSAILFLIAPRNCRSSCSARKMSRWKPRKPGFRSNTRN